VANFDEFLGIFFLIFFAILFQKTENLQQAGYSLFFKIFLAK
jgi:hypothetical protein